MTRSYVCDECGFDLDPEAMVRLDIQRPLSLDQADPRDNERHYHASCWAKVRERLPRTLVIIPEEGTKE